MLAELDFPAAPGKHRELLDAFGEALEPLLRFVVDARTANPNTGPGEQTFAIFHLLARSLSDLLAGGHLVSHCYLTQAHRLIGAPRPRVSASPRRSALTLRRPAPTWATAPLGGETPLREQSRRRALPAPRANGGSDGREVCVSYPSPCPESISRRGHGLQRMDSDAAT